MINSQIQKKQCLTKKWPRGNTTTTTAHVCEMKRIWVCVRVPHSHSVWVWGATLSQSCGAARAVDAREDVGLGVGEMGFVWFLWNP